MDDFDRIIQGDGNVTTEDRIGYIGRHTRSRKAQLLREAKAELKKHDLLIARMILKHRELERTSSAEKRERLLTEWQAMKKASKKAIRRINWLLFKAKFASSRV